jgi:hypothetical protein
MAKNNILWGTERIRGELLKLGIPVSKRTIQKYLTDARPPGNRTQTWTTFIAHHSREVWACDFLQLYDVLFRPIFAFFFVVHGTREVVHFNVTRCPTDAWVAQQLREATPYCDGPTYLNRDNDGKFAHCSPRCFWDSLLFQWFESKVYLNPPRLSSPLLPIFLAESER